MKTVSTKTAAVSIGIAVGLLLLLPTVLGILNDQSGSRANELALLIIIVPFTIAAAVDAGLVVKFIDVKRKK